MFFILEDVDSLHMRKKGKMVLFALIHIITSIRLDIFPALVFFIFPLRIFSSSDLVSLHLNGETKKKVQQSRFKEGNLLRATKPLYLFLFTTIFLPAIWQKTELPKYHAM